MRTLRTIVFFTTLTAAAIAVNGARAEDKLRIEFATQGGFTDPIQTIAYSPDGKFAISGDDKIPKLWDLTTGVLLRTFKGSNDNVSALAFSPDGTRIVSGGWPMRLWDAASGELLREFKVTDYANFVAFSPNGARILAGDRGKTNLWDPDTGNVVQHFEGKPYAAAFSPDGTQVAIASDRAQYALDLWQVSAGALVRSFTGHTDKISAVSFSPRGDLVVSGDEGGTARLWDLKTGQLIRTFDTGGEIGGERESSRRIQTIAFTHGGARVLAGCNAGDSDKGGRGSLIQWETSSGTRLHTAKAEVAKTGESKGFISAVALSPDGKTILSGGAEKVLKRWDADTLTELTPVATSTKAVYDLATSPDGRNLLSSSADSWLKLWDLETGRLQRFVAQSSEPSWVTISPSGANFVFDGALWDISTGARLRQKYSTSKSGVLPAGSELSVSSATIVAFSPDGRRLIAGDHYYKGGWRSPKISVASVWDTLTGKLLQAYKNAGPLVAVSPDGTRIATGDSENTQLRDMRSGALLHTLTAPVRHSQSIAFSPDGRYLTSGAYTWDVSTGALLRSLSPVVVQSALFSPDGNQVATLDPNGFMWIWDANTGRILRFIDNAGKVNAIAFGRSGRWILSGSDDGVIRIWDIASGQQLASLLARPDGAWIAVTPEGFFAGSTEGADMLSVVRGFDVYSIEQFYQALYRPDLVREKLAGDPRGLVREAAASRDLGKVIASGKAPDVKLTLPGGVLNASTRDSQVSVAAEMIDRGGGIGRLEWRVNGVTIGVGPASGTPSSRVSRSVALDPGENDISVVAYNSANLVASVPVHVKVMMSQSGPAAAGNEKPRLFVLAAGVANYADKRIALGTPVADAREVARAFGLSGNLYQSVTVKLMTDGDVTSAKLDAAIQAIAGKASPSDTFVLYLAGHGRTIAGRYYFIPQDMMIDGERTDAVINASAIKGGITQEELQRWFASVPARRSVILFDTCDSGTLTGDAGETQQLERGAASDRLAQATGRSIITASASNEEAQDDYRGHGLFTYFLLDAFNRGDSDNSRTIEVSELAAYVYAQVTDISPKVFKKNQVPHMKITANYPLTAQVRVLKDNADAAPVAKAAQKYQVAQLADLQAEPGVGAAVVRSLSAKTPLTVLQTTKGWSLVASGGTPIGYVATRDLTPLR